LQFAKNSVLLSPAIAVLAGAAGAASGNKQKRLTIMNNKRAGEKGPWLFIGAVLSFVSGRYKPKITFNYNSLNLYFFYKSVARAPLTDRRWFFFRIKLQAWMMKASEFAECKFAKCKTE